MGFGSAFTSLWNKASDTVKQDVAKVATTAKQTVNTVVKTAEQAAQKVENQAEAAAHFIAAQSSKLEGQAVKAVKSVQTAAAKKIAGVHRVLGEETDSADLHAGPSLV